MENIKGIKGTLTQEEGFRRVNPSPWSVYRSRSSEAGGEAADGDETTRNGNSKRIELLLVIVAAFFSLLVVEEGKRTWSDLWVAWHGMRAPAEGGRRWGGPSRRSVRGEGIVEAPPHQATLDGANQPIAVRRPGQRKARPGPRVLRKAGCKVAGTTSARQKDLLDYRVPPVIWIGRGWTRCNWTSKILLKNNYIYILKFM